MQLTLLTLGLCATTALSAAIPFNMPGANALHSDGHQISNPSFDGTANFDLNNMHAKGQSTGVSEGPSGLGATSGLGGSGSGLGAGHAASDDGADIAAEVASIEKLFGKREVGEESEEGEDGELEKRDPATLTAYLIYCLKHPKLCRTVKVH